MTHAPASASRVPATVRRSGWLLAIPVIVILAVVLVNALPYARLVNIDDAYISYRYAQNLLGHGQMVYNLTGDKAFAATAPGYVLLLAGLSAPGFPVDRVGFILGALAIAVAALSLMDMLRRWPLAAGAGAGILLALLPVSWLVIGMESVLVMALVLLSYALTLRRRLGAAALLLVLATALRFDAAAAAGVWGLWLLIMERRGAWRPIAIYAAGTIAFYALLRVALNVPLPTTLASKQAQVALGVTGFGPHTTYLSGLRLLAQAHGEQAITYWFALALAAVGAGGALWLLLRRPEETRLALPSRLELLAPLALLGGWAAAHLAAYLVLGVTPYLWYYLPYFPLVAALIAVGITVLARAAGREARWGVAVAAVLWIVVLAGPLVSHLTIRAAQPELGGGSAVRNDLLVPAQHWGPYKAIGEWLAANATADATAGMMEIGIIGYYSQRHVVDFLGLLDTDIAAALTRGDIAWALHAQQPDYVVLGQGYPLYSHNVYQNRWFQTNYTPATKVMNRVPGGNWFTIYERKAPRPVQGPITELPASAEPLQIRFGDTFELVGFDAPAGPLRPEEPAGMTLYWRVLKAPEKDYTVFVHLLDTTHGPLVAAADGAPLLGARPTSQWQAGELIADFHPLGLPPMPLAPADLKFEVGFFDAAGARLPAFGPDGVEMPGGQAQFGSRQLLPASRMLRFGVGEPDAASVVDVETYRVSAPGLTRGRSEELEVVVQAVRAPVTLTAELWDYPGSRVIWQQSVPVSAPGEYKFQMAPQEGEPANEGELRLRVAQDGSPLSWIDDAGHAISDLAPLTAMRITSP